MEYNNSLSPIEKLAMLLIVLLMLFITVYNINVNYIGHQAVDGNFKNIQQLLLPQGTINIEIESNQDYPDLEVLINGELYDKFNNNKVMIEVMDRDVIQLNSTMYSEEIKIVITDTSSNISTIKVLDQFYVNKNVLTLPIVRL